MRSMTIRNRLLLVLALATLLLVLMPAEGALRVRRLQDEFLHLYRESALPARNLIQVFDHFSNSIFNIPDRVRLGLLTPVQADAELQRIRREIDNAWAEYDQTIGDPDERREAQLARDEIQRALAAIDRMRPVLRSGDRVAVDQLLADEVLPNAEAVSSRMRTLLALNLDQGTSEYERILREMPRGLVASTVLMVLGIVGFNIVGFTIVRSISTSLTRVTGELRALSAGEGNLAQRLPVTERDEVGELSLAFNALLDKLQLLLKGVQEAGIKVAASATELAASAKQQEATVTQQVASTNQVESAARQIAATAEELTQTMQAVTRTAQEAVELAGTGQEDLARMESTIAQMQVASKGIAERLGTINAKAGSINNVVTTITKVADQTNLLSLNAAIEAAKAGELGHGFGVVAREIRRLADQTAAATLDIDATVKEMQVAVSSGVMSMETFTSEVRQAVETISEVSGQLGRIIEQVNVLGPRFMAVGEGMTSQSQGARQISQAMTEVSEAAGQTADGLRESSRAIAQLNEAARELQREVARFGATD